MEAGIVMLLKTIEVLRRVPLFAQRLMPGSMREESGQTIVEYGIILAVIALVAVVAMRVLGVDLSSTLNTMTCWLRPNAAGCQGY